MEQFFKHYQGLSDQSGLDPAERQNTQRQTRKNSCEIKPNSPVILDGTVKLSSGKSFAVSSASSSSVTVSHTQKHVVNQHSAGTVH